jgi:hypothetical protein
LFKTSSLSENIICLGVREPPPMDIIIYKIISALICTTLLGLFHNAPDVSIPGFPLSPEPVPDIPIDNLSLPPVSYVKKS